MKNLYKSDLSKAKNLGAAGEGAHHWFHQRFTAIMLSICILWVFQFFWEISNVNEIAKVIDVLKKPHHIIFLLLFVMVSLYHASLGLKVIIEDYIHCRIMKIMLIFFIQILSIITGLSFIVAVMRIMII